MQNDSGWRTLVTEVLGVPEAATDARFATNVERVRHRPECDALVGARTARWSTADLDARLAAAGIPAAQVKQLDQVVEHPQLARPRPLADDRDRARQAEALLPPATFGDTEARMGDVPALGQHTRALLLESGLDAAAADDTIRRGVARQAAVPVID